MRHFALRQLARFSLCAALAHSVLACGADTDHGPPIGSPPGPTGPIVVEAGGYAGTGQGGANSNAAGGATVTSGGSFDPGAAGTTQFGAGGSGGAGDPFGVGGTATGSDPFGIGGSSSPSFGGSPF